MVYFSHVASCFPRIFELIKNTNKKLNCSTFKELRKAHGGQVIPLCQRSQRAHTSNSTFQYFLNELLTLYKHCTWMLPLDSVVCHKNLHNKVNVRDWIFLFDLMF